MIVLDKLFVDLGENSYNILFSDSFANLSEEVKNVVRSKKILIVTDTNVDKLYREEVEKNLSDGGFDVSSFAFEAGEENKNLATIEAICGACVAAGLDRRSTVVALGGGVCGDMAGFAAAIYMRGIDFIQIPTTLLSQSDSSVGGKTGIDFAGGKNILGAFHQPRLVYINVSVLKTLPKREFISGMGEVIKHGIIADTEFFEYLFRNSDAVKSLDTEVLLKMSKTNCAIKAGVVSKDEKEMGLRAILNFGHTIGHAVESYFDYSVTHGECVGIGMYAATWIAVKKGLTVEKTLEKIRNILELYDFDLKPKFADTERVAEIMKMDKKALNGVINFILPTEIGRVEKCSSVSAKEISEALAVLAERDI